MILTNIWLKLFGTSEWLGLNAGFWIAMTAVSIILIVMNIVFWSLNPKNKQ